MSNDTEVAAMGVVVQALDGLENEEARKRVLSYAATRYGLAASPSAPVQTPGSGTQSNGGQDFDSLAELFDGAGGATATKSIRALIAAYWFNVHEAVTDLDSQSLNTALKDLGYGIGNITDAMSGLMERRPAFAIQTKKQGTSRQARKKYRITEEGRRAVRSMLGGGPIE